MELEWPGDFQRWLERTEGKADAGNAYSRRILELVTAALLQLRELNGAPVAETASLRRVRQSKRYEVWRVSHPFEQGIAVRLICWFPPETNTVVVALFAGEKASIGDVFYNSVGDRADALIDQWRREKERIANE